MWIYLSRKEASKFLSISIRQVDRYVSEGRIKAFKPYGGRRVLIYADSLTEENLKSPIPKFINFED
ncbi:hypothetical protein GCM10011531_17610 [Aquaticitalea lipolytica]|uniref:Helix-turn-helix domain-containing protein n=1 Tax=Aquaticitalea lipolytica TaxID=1247562 RepID=A0A8J2TPQ6_9FLAO|nr:hypothetical protein GCM10011531_17610 [Aquaticitalea lipolytica]